MSMMTTGGGDPAPTGRSLWIDPRAGLSGELFVAALGGLGVPEPALLATLQRAGEAWGWVDAHTHLSFLPDGTTGRQLHITWLRGPAPIAPDQAPQCLDDALAQTDVTGPYAEFARQALARLLETGAPPPTLPAGSGVLLTVIGQAHTPYQHTAPYQPQTVNMDEDACFIELDPRYAEGLESLETFSHIFVLSYLDRSQGFQLTVTPPWQDRPQPRGLFATRAPNRPSAIGLTRTRVRRVEGHRIFTGPLDLFDGTPVLDIKPYIGSLDGGAGADEAAPEAGNDGWLSGSEHLELHRRGVPHAHPGQSRPGQLADTLLWLVGAAWGLQWLAVDLAAVVCLAPTSAEGMDHLTAEGRALLAALQARFVPGAGQPWRGSQVGVGLGASQPANQAPVLRLWVQETESSV
ncbi:MAG: tRNA (N6-threonylcarbamoyladenosine(37)-N6)-methyltransferase TrmO [Anaerolineae bacterium]